MKLGQLNSNKMALCASYFRRSRLVNSDVYHRFFDRVTSHYKNARDSSSKLKLKSVKKDKKPLFYTAFFIGRQLLRVPSYFVQYIKIVHLSKDDLRNVGVIAIASSRLQLSKEIEVRKSILALSRILGTESYLDIVQVQCESNDDLLLFDPLMESDYWYQKNECWREKVYIVDGAFLLFFSIWTTIGALFSKQDNSVKFVVEYLKQCKKIEPPYKGRKILNLFESAIYISINKLFERYSAISAIFFTSNSTLTEILRFYLLQNDNSIKIVEVLHGIIAAPTEKYYHSVLNTFDAAGHCHYFVPQIPGLPDLDLLNSKLFYPNDIAVNAHINKSINIYSTKYGTLDDFFTRQLSEYKLKDVANDVLFLTVFGGTSLQGNYYTSAGFKVELELIDKAIQYSDEFKLNIRFLYVPHPANGQLLEGAKQALSIRNLSIIHDSFFTYFITDYCISILSSCIFELAWMGANSFTPMLVGDGFYSKGYLNKAFYPRENNEESLNDEFMKFLLSGQTETNKTLSQKIEARLNLIQKS